MQKALSQKQLSEKICSSAITTTGFLVSVILLFFTTFPAHVFGCDCQPGETYNVQATVSKRCHLKDGTFVADGQSWSQDRCTYCTCMGGVVSCVPTACSSYPQTVPPQNTSFCGSSFIDRTNNETYGTIAIGSTCWMTKNLNAGMLGNTKYCYLDRESNCSAYGALYTYTQAQSACPSGWRLPTDAEWNAVNTFSGLTSILFNHFGQYYVNAYMHLHAYGIYWSDTSGAYWKAPSDAVAGLYTKSVAENRRLSVRCVRVVQPQESILGVQQQGSYGTVCPTTNGVALVNSIFLTGSPTTVWIVGQHGVVTGWEYYQNGAWKSWGGTEGKTSITWVATPCVGCKFRAKIQNNTCGMAYTTETGALIKQ